MAKNKGHNPYAKFTGIYGDRLTTVAEIRTEQLNLFYRKRIIEMAVHRFKWTGLPDTVDERFLEMTLLFNGLAVAYQDKINKENMIDDNGEKALLILRCASMGRVNMYDNPTHFVVTGNQLVQNKTISINDCVPIWDSYTRSPSWDLIELYASKLADIDRTFELNMIQLRTPWMVTTTEEKRDSTVRALNAMMKGETSIMTYDPTFPESFQTFITGMSSQQPLDVLLAKQKVWNECMTFLGINNSNQDKKERLVVAEVSANDPQVDSYRLAGLDSRKLACEQINAMFGTNISVEWNEMPREELTDNNTEGDDNGSDDNAVQGRSES